MLSVFWKPFTFGPSYDDAQSGGDISDDTKTYISNNISDNVILDGDYYNINANFINNVNQKVQADVHALDGYYYIESSGPISYATMDKLFRQVYPSGTYFSHATGNSYNEIVGVLNAHKSFFVVNRGYFTYAGLLPIDCPDSYCLIIDRQNIRCFDVSKNVIIYDKIFYERTFNGASSSSYSACSDINKSRYLNSSICLGDSVKIFYSPQDARNYYNQGRHYAPRLPSNTTIRIPVSYIQNNTSYPTINYNFNTQNMTETEIQNQIDLTVKAYLEKLFDVNIPGGGGSGGSGGGGSGSGSGSGSGGGSGAPTPTPSVPDGFFGDTTDILEKIYNWLVQFGINHDTFAAKISQYIEKNDGKLDEIIVAINALADGKTETEVNGCKYDFSALSDYLSRLWNDSDQKFDEMVKLLKENNEYQEKLVDSLNEIKAILVTQTILDLFQDRSSDTANKAKEKFPTSIPWDVAIVVNAMAAEPKELKFTIPLTVTSLGIHEEITVDLTDNAWNNLAKACRYLLSILFILYMIHLSRKMFFSGGDD